MRPSLDRARWRALVLLLSFVACAALAPQAVRAQDPRAAAAQRVAREWLALVDKLRREREARGTLVQRAAADTAFANSGVGLPEGGNYAIVAFRSSFANQIDAREEVMLEVGPDYAWHVIGYVIQ